MHSALLPVHEHFLPKDNAWSRKVGSWRHWKATLRRKNKTSIAKMTILFLLCTLAIVKTIIVPYRISSTRRSLRGIYSIEGPPADTQPNDVYEKWGPQVELYDLSAQTASSSAAAQNREYLLLLIPLRNAEPVLQMMFSHLQNLTYPHSLIDLSFLIGDSTDDTYTKLQDTLSEIQSSWPKDQLFNRVDVYKHDFGAKIGQGVDQRHGVAVQAERRKLMGRARNWLLGTALRPYHSWVYWRDADIESSPTTIIEDLMGFDQDVIVPNVWRPLPKWLGTEQPYDLNSWVESEAALELARTLKEDDVIVEGYAEYPTWRIHLAYLRDTEGNGDRNEILPLDGIGGVSILSKARVFRTGANFPGFSFLNHVETEGFGKMSRKMGYSVAGLPQYTIWHKYEPSDDDIKKMEEMTAMGLPID